jgi:hypothetical protein
MLSDSANFLLGASNVNAQCRQKRNFNTQSYTLDTKVLVRRWKIRYLSHIKGHKLRRKS